MKKILRKLYLTPGIALGIGGGFAALVAALGYLVSIDAISAEISLVLLWMTLLVVVSCLMVRRWIIRCQKTLLQKICEHELPRSDSRMYKVPTSFDAHSYSSDMPMGKKMREGIKQPDHMA